MRVLMPNSTLVTVEKVVPATERRIWFNGRTMRFCERATEIGCANGLGFFLETQVRDNFGMATGDAAFIGNLQNEFVREVLATLVQQGYVDLSGLKLQKTQPLTTCYVVDGGASGAYQLYGFEAGMCCAEAFAPFMGGAFPASLLLFVLMERTPAISPKGNPCNYKSIFNMLNNHNSYPIQ